MGQAQLLLIVLGVVLVGIAIIAGIQAYTSNNVKASLDAQVHDMMRVASDAQVWAQKPPQFGGPDVYAALDEITDFSTLNYRNSDGTGAAGTWTNVNAVFTWTSETNVTSTNADLGTSAALSICGINDTDIFVATSAGAAAAAPGCAVAP